ncbi:MAG: glycosyltransferase [Prevotellaceae bacterium]|jgi:glycosyltransferase involved in cell wall biosynthesis|nr:glycosyltransferase [Prevotellaceae bacterium]
MRICFVTTGDIVSIATLKRATGMATPLIRSGHEVAIIAMDCENNRERIRLECPDITPLYFPSGNFISEIFHKKRLIKSWNPDLVYVCAFVVRNFIHKKNMRMKHSCYIVEHSELGSAIRENKWHKKILAWILEWSAIFLFDGQVTASRYLETLFKQKNRKFRRKQPILYSPYAYNKDILLPDPVLSATLKNKYGSKKIILYMGSLSLNYGFLDILKAADILQKKRDDFIVLIIGNGKHKDIGKQYVKEHQLYEYIYFLNYVPEEELPSYFNIADIFISPINDTIQDKARCPSKLFMYLPFKKPIVTCSIGEAYELFGENGYYYEWSDTNMLAEIIDMAIDNSNNLKYFIEIDNHTWEYRTNEFLIWTQTHLIEKL